MKSIGVSYPISYGNLGYFQQTNDYDSTVRSNLIMFFSTIKGERRLNSLYGTEIWKYVFENGLQENEEILKDIIKKEILSIFPSVEVKSIEINQKEVSRNIYNLEIKILYFSSRFNNNLQSIVLGMPISSQ